MSTVVEFHKREWDFLKSRLRELEETKQRKMQEIYLVLDLKTITLQKTLTVLNPLQIMADY